MQKLEQAPIFFTFYPDMSTVSIRLAKGQLRVDIRGPCITWPLSIWEILNIDCSS